MTVNWSQRTETDFYWKFWESIFSSKFAPIIRNRFLVQNFKIQFFVSLRQKSTLNVIFRRKNSMIFCRSKNPRFFWKKIVTRKKLMIFLVKKLTILLKKAKIRLRNKTPQKKFRLRRHLSAQFLKKFQCGEAALGASRLAPQKIIFCCRE